MQKDNIAEYLSKANNQLQIMKSIIDDKKLVKNAAVYSYNSFKHSLYALLIHFEIEFTEERKPLLYFFYKIEKYISFYFDHNLLIYLELIVTGIDNDNKLEVTEKQINDFYNLSFHFYQYVSKLIKDESNKSH